MKDWGNIQPWPNPKPVRVVKVAVTLPGATDQNEQHHSYGFLHVPVAGKLKKIQMAEIGKPGA